MTSPSAGDRERQKSDGAGALDGQGDLALMTRAVARDAPRNDLAPIADEVLEGLRVLVIDGDRLVRAELADALAGAAPAAGSIRVQIGRPAEIFVVAEIDVALAHGFFSSLTPVLEAGLSDLGASGTTQSSSSVSSISSPNSLSGARGRSTSGASTSPSAFSRDSSFSSSGAASMRANFTSSGSTATLSP